MGRPSLKEERSIEILDAYEICVARYGLDGATLERVAEEAGLARPLIRHNVGNRDDLQNALIDRFFEQSSAHLRSMTQNLPENGPAHALIETLFEGSSRDHKSVLVAEALIAAAAKNPALAERLRVWLENYVGVLASVLKAQFPKADDNDIEAIAAGTTGIYFNVESMVMLGPMPNFKASSKRAVFMLVRALEK